VCLAWEKGWVVDHGAGSDVMCTLVAAWLLKEDSSSNSRRPAHYQVCGYGIGRGGGGTRGRLWHGT
jgi:hypothetical protein